MMVYCFFNSTERFLDRGGGKRIEARGGVVEQDHIRFQGQAAGQAQPLLLAAGQGEGRTVQPIFDLIPQRRLLQRLLDPLLQHRPHS